MVSVQVKPKPSSKEKAASKEEKDTAYIPTNNK